MFDSKVANLIIALGAFNACIAVAAGAFAAHGLKASLSSEYLTIFRTAADYQMIHAIGLILIGMLHSQHSSRGIVVSAALLLTGIMLFSGSLYLLAITGISWLGMITPFGGLCFLAGWFILGLNSLRNRKS